MNTGSAERRLVTRAYFDEELQEAYNTILEPEQNGAGIQGEISITAVGVQAVLDACMPRLWSIRGRLEKWLQLN